MCPTPARSSRRTSMSGGMEIFLRQASFRCRRASTGGCGNDEATLPLGSKRGVTRNHSGRSLNSSCSEESFMTTVSTHSLRDKKSCHSAAPKKVKKNHLNHVSFCEENNEYYAATKRHESARTSAKWYSKKDIQGFRKENALKLSELCRMDPAASQGKLLKGFLQTYQRLSLSKSSEDVEKIFMSCRVLSYDADMVGLERCILKVIETDRQARRQKVMRTIHSVQDNGCSDDVQRSKKIFKACRSASRPSRLFAHYIGVLSAHATTEEVEDSKVHKPASYVHKKPTASAA